MKKINRKRIICLIALLAALLLVSVFFLPHHQRTSAKRLPDLYQTQVPQFYSAVDKDGDGIDDQMDILQGALAYVSTQPRYKSKYYSTGYPNDGYGVCTDVVAFAMRGAGYDLMELVLTTDLSDIEEWQGGDIVIFKNHIGVVSDRRNKDGVPYVIHHNSPHQVSYEEDILEKRDDLVAHYRISE